MSHQLFLNKRNSCAKFSYSEHSTFSCNRFINKNNFAFVVVAVVVVWISDLANTGALTGIVTGGPGLGAQIVLSGERCQKMEPTVRKIIRLEDFPEKPCFKARTRTCWEAGGVEEKGNGPLG